MSHGQTFHWGKFPPDRHLEKVEAFLAIHYQDRVRRDSASSRASAGSSSHDGEPAIFQGQAI